MPKSVQDASWDRLGVQKEVAGLFIGTRFGSQNGTKIDLGATFGRLGGTFLGYLVAHRFCIDFSTILGRFWDGFGMVFGLQNRSQRRPKSKKADLQKHWFYCNKTYIFQGSAFPRQTKNPIKMVVKTVSNIKSILRRLWGRFGDCFGEDFGGPGRSWGGKREAKRRKKATRKGSQKKTHFRRGSCRPRRETLWPVSRA